MKEIKEIMNFLNCIHHIFEKILNKANSVLEKAYEDFSKIDQKRGYTYLPAFYYIASLNEAIEVLTQLIIFIQEDCYKHFLKMDFEALKQIKVTEWANLYDFVKDAIDSWTSLYYSAKELKNKAEKLDKICDEIEKINREVKLTVPY